MTAEQTNIAAIVQAAHDIAKLSSGITWGGDKVWDFPTAEEVTAASWPYLVVTMPESDGGAVAGNRQGGGMIPRIPGVSEPVWAVDVWAIYPFRDATNPLTYSVPHQAMAALLAVFTDNWTLNNTCDFMLIDKPRVERPPAMPGQRHIAAHLRLHCYEQLSVTY